MPQPRILDDHLFRAIRLGDTDEIKRQQTLSTGPIDFSGADLRGADLRYVDLSRVIIRNAYLKDADLRGLDLRQVDLEGCSLHDAKVGGAFFPDSISAAELCMSVEYGTRLRAHAKARKAARSAALARPAKLTGAI